jgi:hypothetical protein
MLLRQKQSSMELSDIIAHRLIFHKKEEPDMTRTYTDTHDGHHQMVIIMMKSGLPDDISCAFRCKNESDILQNN